MSKRFVGDESVEHVIFDDIKGMLNHFAYWMIGEGIDIRFHDFKVLKGVDSYLCKCTRRPHENE